MRKRRSDGYSLVTSVHVCVCVLVIAQEDAGKAGRVQDSERNTNATTYLCSAPALTFFHLLGAIHMLAGLERRRLRAAETLE